MTVGQQTDHHQQEDDEDPEDDLDLPVPEGGDPVEVPGLTGVVGRDWGPAVTHPLPLDLRAGDAVTRLESVTTTSDMALTWGGGGLAGAEGWWGPAPGTLEESVGRRSSQLDRDRECLPGDSSQEEESSWALG